MNSAFVPFQQNALGGIPSPQVTPPTTLAASATWQSGVLNCGGFYALAAAAKLTQAGTISIQRYIDLAGSLPFGGAITQSMSANTLATVYVKDGQPAASWQVTITNTSGSTATLSNVALLVQQ